MEKGAESENFDFIFAGAGMSAASLLLRMLARPELRNSKILIADPQPFGGKPKTWCFWEKEAGFFEALVHKSWEKAWFKGADFSLKMQLLPYRYKMIRSENFFGYALSSVRKHSNIRILEEGVQQIHNGVSGLEVMSSSGKIYQAPVVFSSIPPATEKKPGHFYLLQHFTGWFIKTNHPTFNPEEPILMDFSISQKGDCRFMYLLPFSETEALAEYTLFSETLLQDEEYEAELRDYLAEVAPGGYKIVEREQGVIPMYSASFPQSSIPGLVHLGTRGNQTKASTGYTFRAVQKHSEAILQQLLRNEIPDAGLLGPAARFSWFDRVLLRVLAEKRMEGRLIFEHLFRKNPVQRVFRFLDEESAIPEELLIMNSVPATKFLLPGIRELFREFSGR